TTQSTAPPSAPPFAPGARPLAALLTTRAYAAGAAVVYRGNHATVRALPTESSRKRRVLFVAAPTAARPLPRLDLVAPPPRAGGLAAGGDGRGGGRVAARATHRYLGAPAVGRPGGQGAPPHLGPHRRHRGAGDRRREPRPRRQPALRRGARRPHPRAAA